MRKYLLCWLSLEIVVAAAAQSNTYPSSGNVGIGTLAPRAALEVATSGTYFRDQVYTFDLSTISAGGGWARDFRIYDEFNTSSRVYMGAYGGNGQVTRAYWMIGNDPNPLYPGWNLTTGISLLSSGNVGIGTLSPGAKLEVATPSGEAAIHINSTNSQPVLRLQQNGTTKWSLIAEYPTTGLLDFYSPVAQHVMVLANTGNVGIGTTNPTQKLSVNGTIQAKEVIVQTGWSDYVFDDNYRLAPLSDVEAHIKAEKHLPGIPSKKEVAEQGVSLGEMQAKLLAKIEELTLHQIEQEKAIAGLRARNDALTTEVAALKKSP